MSIEKVKFFVDHNKNDKGEHTVHRLTCPVGKYREASDAVHHAIKSDFDPAVACQDCCPECFE